MNAPILHSNPCRSEHAQSRRVGRDTLIVHLLLKQYHILNDVAGRIWELSDGSRSADDIADTIAGEFRADGEAVRKDVADTIASLTALRLLESGAPS